MFEFFFHRPSRHFNTVDGDNYNSLCDIVGEEKTSAINQLQCFIFSPESRNFFWDYALNRNLKPDFVDVRNSLQDVYAQSFACLKDDETSDKDIEYSAVLLVERCIVSIGSSGSGDNAINTTKIRKRVQQLRIYPHFEMKDWPTTRIRDLLSHESNETDTDVIVAIYIGFSPILPPIAKIQYLFTSGETPITSQNLGSPGMYIPAEWFMEWSQKQSQMSYITYENPNEIFDWMNYASPENSPNEWITTMSILPVFVNSFKYLYCSWPSTNEEILLPYQATFQDVHELTLRTSLLSLTSAASPPSQSPSSLSSQELHDEPKIKIRVERHECHEFHSMTFYFEQRTFDIQRLVQNSNLSYAIHLFCKWMNYCYRLNRDDLLCDNMSMMFDASNNYSLKKSAIKQNFVTTGGNPVYLSAEELKTTLATGIYELVFFCFVR
jgi:hypothetical protein